MTRFEPSYRSPLERTNGELLAEHYGAPPPYECVEIPFHSPTSYLPDFVLLNGIVIETKGWFRSEDRRKHLLIKSQYPALEVRFVFWRPHQKLAKKSPRTYADWCDLKGFKWAPKVIPREWLDEPVHAASLKCLKRLGYSYSPASNRVP